MRYLTGFFVVLPVFSLLLGLEVQRQSSAIPTDSKSVLISNREPTPRPPEAAIIVPVKCVEVVDGDTLTVEVTVRMRTRLLDCWAPELRDPGGIASKSELTRLALGKHGRMRVPLDGVSRVDQVFTFGRILADVWVDDASLSQQMVTRGFATKIKSK